MHISLKELLASGAHFGHQTRRWNPRMKPYLYATKGGIHIIDLQKTAHQLAAALTKVHLLAAEGRTILFVSTKPQSIKIVEEEARRCRMPYITRRWLGGFLTNWKTIKKRIKHYNSILDQEKRGEFHKFTKKEQAVKQREIKKLNNLLSGVRLLTEQPDAIILLDVTRDKIAIAEAQKTHIPVIGILDSNADPAGVDYPIPGNDDSPKAIKYYFKLFADAILEGRGSYVPPPADQTAGDKHPAKAKPKPQKETAKNIRPKASQTIKQTKATKSSKTTPSPKPTKTPKKELTKISK